MAVTVFSLFGIAFIMMLSASVRSQISTHNKTIAEQLATQKIEEARSLSYDNVGIVSGNPAGTIPATANSTIGGITYKVDTSVDYVDDPLPTGFQTYANYKKVSVTISKNSVNYASLTTIVAPPTPPQLNKGVIKATIIDYGTNQPIQGAVVTLSSGPSGTIVDTTPSDGTVIFPNLIPNPSSGSTAYYNLSATYPGYKILPEDVSPASAAHLQVSQTQVRATTIRMYKPSSITVNFVDGSGNPFTGSGTLYLSSSRQFGTVAFSGGSATINSINGEDVIPGLSYDFGAISGSNFAATVSATIPDNYPTVTSDSVTLVMTPASGTATLSVTVKDASSGSTISNAKVTISDGPKNIYLIGTTNSSGVVNFTVPTSSSVLYTITFPKQGSRLLVEKTSTVPGPGTKAVTLNV